MAEVLRKLAGSVTFFDGVHIFTPHNDVPDDSALRLIFLTPEYWYSKDERVAFEAVLDYSRNNGKKPRHRANRLIFLAADFGALQRFRDCILVALAWGSIVDDVGAMRLVLDNLQVQQAKRELQTAEEVLPRVARECYKWLLCPTQNSALDPKPNVEAFPLNTSGSGLGNEIERVCVDNELVITKWSPIHLRSKLQELYWKREKVAVEAMHFWEDTLRYCYQPRLKSRDVLAQAISKGAASKDFFGTAYGQHGGSFDGFKLGDANVQFDDTLLLIEPTEAAIYEAKLVEAAAAVSAPTTEPTVASQSNGAPKAPSPSAATAPLPAKPSVPKSTTFHSSVDINPATAKVRLVQLAEEIISTLASDPQAELKITVEINADFPSGASDQIKRTISENSNSLGIAGLWE
jgi:hypothetical protein